MIRFPFSVISCLDVGDEISTPSLNHRILGGGIPVAAQSTSAISPTVNVRRRLASSIVGGSDKTHQNIL